MENGEWELTEGVTRVKPHYRFQVDFCTPTNSNEKGNVENKVGYSRRNAFYRCPQSFPLRSSTRSVGVV